MLCANIVWKCILLLFSRQNSGKITICICMYYMVQTIVATVMYTKLLQSFEKLYFLRCDPNYYYLIIRIQKWIMMHTQVKEPIPWKGIRIYTTPPHELVAMDMSNSACLTMQMFKHNVTKCQWKLMSMDLTISLLKICVF
jgi:hypothetical protein